MNCDYCDKKGKYGDFVKNNNIETYIVVCDEHLKELLNNKGE